jgi:hypothetical protein
LSEFGGKPGASASCIREIGHQQPNMFPLSAGAMALDSLILGIAISDESVVEDAMARAKRAIYTVVHGS